MITLPALMMLGMPVDVANATNRVGVLMQSLTGVKGFSDQDRLDKSAIFPILVPTIVGALAGSMLASFMPVWVLKPVLLGSMITMALVMVVRPQAIIPVDGTEPYKLTDRPVAVLGLFLTGVYGGFVQAGVGFILIAALAGGLRYDSGKDKRAQKPVYRGLFRCRAGYFCDARPSLVDSRFDISGW